MVPAVDSTEEECITGKIVKAKVVRNKAQYEVQLEGYPAADNQFRSEAELCELDPELLQGYLEAKAAQVAATCPSRQR